MTQMRFLHSSHTDAEGAHRAFVLLRTVFTVAPILFGLDKFLEITANWEVYLAPWAEAITPGTAQQVMYAVGVVEIVAGVLVALRPMWGGYVVAAWLAGIIINLVSMGAYLDVALRDFGLLVAALALASLAASPAATSAATRAGKSA